MKLPIRLALSRCTGPDGVVYALHVTDVDAGVRFVSADLTPEQFASLVSGSEIMVDADARLECVGMRAEHREEVVTFPALAGPREARVSLAEAIIHETGAAMDMDAPAGATPWKGRVSDAFNTHRQEGSTFTSFKARVTFRRFVPRVEG